MYIHSLQVKNFRNQEGRTVLFHPQRNLVIGNNGAGKTSMLEAIHTIAITKSFKAKKEIEVIKNGQDNAFIQLSRQGEQQHDLIRLSVSYQKLTESRIKKTYMIDDAAKRASGFIGHFFSVLFTTDLMNEFSEKAATRRKIINQFLSQLDKEYVSELATCEKILRNKNRLLKMIREGSSPVLLDYWNNELIERGSIIVFKRYEFLKKLETFLKVHNDQGDFLKNKIDIAYITRYTQAYTREDIREKLRMDLLTHTQIEIDAGRCLVGPQKDDLDVFFNSKNIKTFASRGEQKFSMALLLYAIARYIEEVTQEKPVILLDDLRAEMDTKNLKTILQLFIDTDYQLIVTTIERDSYADMFNKIIKLK